VEELKKKVERDLNDVLDMLSQNVSSLEDTHRNISRVCDEERERSEETVASQLAFIRESLQQVNESLVATANSDRERLREHHALMRTSSFISL
jgi:uncharacterized protein YfkK (UPF0435 family)